MRTELQQPFDLLKQWPLYAVWLALFVFLGWPAWPDPLISGPLGQDDALRLVQVRDLLAGQNWYDLTQHRLQPPIGLEMHWSRLLDAPMAVLSYVFGERAMLFIWPGLLIGGFLFSALYITRKLDRGIALLPVLIVSAASLVPLSYFAPARIDHHNVQLILGLVFAGTLIQPWNSSRPALLAALMAALMMAVGLETIPYLAMGLIIIGISWAFDYSTSKSISVFGLAFVGFTALAWLAQTDAQSQLPVCDMLSAAYVFPIAIGGTGIALAARFGSGFGIIGRLSLLAFVGLAAVAALGFINPTCFAGPMAQVPLELQERWLTTVAEAQPFSAIIASTPKMAVERFGPPFFGLLLGFWLVWKYPGHRYGLIICLAFLLVALAITMAQLRGSLFAHAFIIPIFAFAIHRARNFYNQNQKSGLAIAAMALAFLFCQSLFFVFAASYLPEFNTVKAAEPTAISTITAAPQLTEVERECAEPAVRSHVAALGKGLIATPIFFGAQVLEMGEAPVIAGPYHRATDAIFDTLKFFEDGEVAEAKILDQWKPAYVVLCLTSGDTQDTVLKYPNSLTARLVEGNVPNWLNPLPQAGQLGIYSVNPRN